MTMPWIKHLYTLVKYDEATPSPEMMLQVLSACEVATDALELLADKENWSDGSWPQADQHACLYGHFTAREVAQRALKKIRGEEVEP